MSTSDGEHDSLHAQSAIPHPKKSKRQQDLERCPEEKIVFRDIEGEALTVAVEAAKLAFLAKSKGEVANWTEAAESIKKEMDSRTGPTWHCITGKSFGSYVSHESQHIVYFFIGEMGVLLFKHG